MTDRDSRPAGTRSIEAIQADFRERDYITDRSLATAVFLALELGRPLLLEGEAGVGKTELAKVLAASLGAPLIRLQCYEGLDVNTAVYEWNYPRQMLEIRLLEARGEADRASAHDIFGTDFLIRRPLLQALEVTDGGRAGAAHRRDRPGRRGVRGLPARDPVRLPGHGPGDRHDQGGAAAAGDPDLEPDARGPRRAQAALPVPLDRLPDRPEGVRDRARAGARGARAPRPRGRRVRPSPARGGPDQGAGDRRDARLGGGAPVARGARAAARAGRRDPRRRPQVRGGHPPGPRRHRAAATSPRPRRAAEDPCPTPPSSVSRSGPRSMGGACWASPSASAGRSGRPGCRSTSARRSTSPAR